MTTAVQRFCEEIEALLRYAWRVLAAHPITHQDALVIALGSSRQC